VSKQTAADLICALSNIPFWRSLVVDRGWSARRYEDYLKRILRSAVCHTD